MTLRVILAGTRSFGLGVYERLTQIPATVELVGVVAPPDDKLQRRVSSVDVPWAPHIEETWVRRAHADVMVCAHTTDFVGQRSRRALRYGAIVGHPSLLPRHRGRSSVEWTVRMRDPIAGFTAFWADNGVDTGPIIGQDWCHVDPAWSASQLWSERLFTMGLDVIEDALHKVDRKGWVGETQDKRFATTEPAIEPLKLHRPELLELPAPRR